MNNNKPRQKLKDNQLQIISSRLGKQSLPAQSNKPVLNMTNASKYQILSKQMAKGIDPQKTQKDHPPTTSHKYNAQSFATSRSNVAGMVTGPQGQATTQLNANKRPMSYSTIGKKTDPHQPKQQPSMNIKGKSINQNRNEPKLAQLTKMTVDQLQQMVAAKGNAGQKNQIDLTARHQNVAHHQPQQQHFLHGLVTQRDGDNFKKDDKSRYISKVKNSTATMSPNKAQSKNQREDAKRGNSGNQQIITSIDHQDLTTRLHSYNQTLEYASLDTSIDKKTDQSKNNGGLARGAPVAPVLTGGSSHPHSSTNIADDGVSKQVRNGTTSYIKNMAKTGNAPPMGVGSSSKAFNSNNKTQSNNKNYQFQHLPAHQHRALSGGPQNLTSVNQGATMRPAQTQRKQEDQGQNGQSTNHLTSRIVTARLSNQNYGWMKKLDGNRIAQAAPNKSSNSLQPVKQTGGIITSQKLLHQQITQQPQPTTSSDLNDEQQMVQGPLPDFDLQQMILDGLISINTHSFQDKLLSMGKEAIDPNMFNQTAQMPDIGKDLVDGLNILQDASDQMNNNMTALTNTQTQLRDIQKQHSQVQRIQSRSRSEVKLGANADQGTCTTQMAASYMIQSDDHQQTQQSGSYQIIQQKNTSQSPPRDEGHRTTILRKKSAISQRINNQNMIKTVHNTSTNQHIYSIADEQNSDGQSNIQYKHPNQMPFNQESLLKMQMQVKKYSEVPDNLNNIQPAQKLSLASKMEADYSRTQADESQMYLKQGLENPQYLNLQAQSANLNQEAGHTNVSISQNHATINQHADINEAFSQCRDSRTPLKITPKLQKDHFDPAQRYAQDQQNQEIQGNKKMVEHAFSPQTSPQIKKIIRKINYQNMTGMSKTKLEANKQIFQEHKAALGLINKLPGQSNLKGASRYSVDAEEEIKPCLTELSMITGHSQQHSNQQPFINRFKKKINEPKFIQKLKSARVYTQGATTSLQERYQQSKRLAKQNLDQSQLHMIDQSTEKQFNAPKLQNKSQHPPKFGGMPMKKTNFGATHKQRQKQLNSSVSSFYSDQQNHQLINEKRPNGFNQSQHSFVNKNTAMKKPINETREAMGNIKPNLLYQNKVSNSQVVNKNQNQDVKKMLMANQKGLPVHPSLFKESKDSVIGGAISQSNSSSKIGNKKSPKFVQINLQMYNNFLPSSITSQQGIMTAGSNTNVRLNTINFAENPSPNHFTKILQSSPEQFGKTDVFDHQFQNIKNNHLLQQTYKRPISQIDTGTIQTKRTNHFEKSPHESLLQSDKFAQGSGTVSSDPQYVVKTPTTELITNQIELMSQQIEQIQNQQKIYFKQLKDHQKQKVQQQLPGLEKLSNIDQQLLYQSHIFQNLKKLQNNEQKFSKQSLKKEDFRQKKIKNIMNMSGTAQVPNLEDLIFDQKQLDSSPAITQQRRSVNNLIQINSVEKPQKEMQSSTVNLRNQIENQILQPIFTKQQNFNELNKSVAGLSSKKSLNEPRQNKTQPKAHSTEREQQQLTATSQGSFKNIQNIVSIENINTGLKQDFQSNILDGTGQLVRTPIYAGKPLMNTFLEPSRSLSIFKINTNVDPSVQGNAKRAISSNQHNNTTTSFNAIPTKSKKGQRNSTSSTFQQKPKLHQLHLQQQPNQNNTSENLMDQIQKIKTLNSLKIQQISNGNVSAGLPGKSLKTAVQGIKASSGSLGGNKEIAEKIQLSPGNLKKKGSRKKIGPRREDVSIKSQEHDNNDFQQVNELNHINSQIQDDAYSSNVINILEIEKIEAKYRHQLEENLISMRDNHANQINSLMEVIKQKDNKIKQLQLNQQSIKQQDTQQNKIEGVYAMIGKVRHNMDVIAEMNKMAHEQHLVNTISSSNSSPSHTIKSVSMRQSNPFGGDRSMNSKSERSMQGSVSFRNRQTIQLPMIPKPLTHHGNRSLLQQYSQYPRNLQSEQQMFLDLQKVLDDDNGSDKLALSNTIHNTKTFDENKRLSLETINSNINNLNHSNDPSSAAQNSRIKSHSAIIRNNKSSTSRAGHGEVSTSRYLAPIFSSGSPGGADGEEESHLESIIQIKDQYQEGDESDLLGDIRHQERQDDF